MLKNVINWKINIGSDTFLIKSGATAEVTLEYVNKKDLWRKSACNAP